MKIFGFSLSKNLADKFRNSPTKYSKTPIYRAPIYRVPRFTGPQFYPPKTSFMCESMQKVPRFTVLLDLPGLIPFSQEAR